MKNNTLPKKNLTDYPILKLSEGESVVCIQRIHPLAFFLAATTRFVAEVFLFVSFLLLVNTPILFSSTVLVNGFVALAGVTSILLVEIYAFLSWYYQFYMITNKAIIHKRFFRIAGGYSEVVFLDQMHQQEIDRNPPNLLYDYLRIENVTVRFHKFERDEPFVFTTPENAQEIEDAIQDITIQTKI